MFGKIPKKLSIIDNAKLAVANVFTANNTFSRLVFFAPGANIASAATIDLTIATGNTVNVTGTTPTTAFTITAGQEMKLISQAAWPLTHHATNLNLPGGVNYTCAAGDRILVIKDLAGVVYVSIWKADGTAVVAPSTGIVGTAASIPTTGTYTSGQIVINTAAATNAKLLGWKRLTTGSAHVLNTDWIELTSGITLSTAQNTTSGTSIDFTSIPAWVKRITVMFSAVSGSATSAPMLQLGVSGTPETTSYAGASGQFTGAATAVTAHSIGFLLKASSLAADGIYGTATITLLNGATNLWSFAFSGGSVGTAHAFTGGGTKALAGVLNMIRLTTVNGTDTFDAGSVNIMYE